MACLYAVLGFLMGQRFATKMIIYCAYRLNVLFLNCRNMDAACVQYGEKTKMSLLQCLDFATSWQLGYAVFFWDKASATFVMWKVIAVFEGYRHLFSCHYLEFLKCLVPKCDLSIQSNPSFNIKEVTFVAVITHKVKLKDFSVKDDLRFVSGL